jgi:2-amino-4-hydroxy-6-hydroxymethyldihydropteridine diphosphokinase
MTHNIFLALGSNIGNKQRYIDEAIQHLGPNVTNIRLSKIYETKPMYFEAQDVFLNAVLQAETNLTPVELLPFVKKLETKIGRLTRFPNGPREIDIDILFYEDLIYSDELLTIPHPGIAQRDFVLRPLMDLAPELIHPVLRKSVAELFAEFIARA